MSGFYFTMLGLVLREHLLPHVRLNALVSSNLTRHPCRPSAYCAEALETRLNLSLIPSTKHVPQALLRTMTLYA